MGDRHDVIIVCDRDPTPVELHRFEVRDDTGPPLDEALIADESLPEHRGTLDDPPTNLAEWEASIKKSLANPSPRPNWQWVNDEERGERDRMRLVGTTTRQDQEHPRVIRDSLAQRYIGWRSRVAPLLLGMRTRLHLCSNAAG